MSSKELQDRVTSQIKSINRMDWRECQRKAMTGLFRELSTALKQEQAKATKYKKALKTISEWQDTSDSQDAISAANTAIEALGDDYD